MLLNYEPDSVTADNVKEFIKKLKIKRKGYIQRFKFSL